MGKGMKIVVFVISFFIIFLIFSFIFTIFYVNYTQKRQDVSSSDDVAIRKYIKQFYNKLNDSPLGISSWFLNEKISFYIQDDITFIEKANDTISGSADSPESFDKLFQSFSEYAGNMQNYSVSSIEYYLQPYDVGESNLYYLNVNVIYENLRANESFWLKNVDGGWKIFRYWIEYDTSSYKEN